eukprot:5131507-Pyramimonas_sp.AAC.1
MECVVRLAQVTSAPVIERALHSEFPQCCAAVSAMVEDAGSRARFLGQNIMANAQLWHSD